MMSLFGYLKNIYKIHEPKEEATIGKFPIVQMERRRESTVFLIEIVQRRKK